MTATNLKLHGHSQLLTYTDPSQWLKPSFQGHFGLGAIGNDPTQSAHVHVEPQFPCYAELNAQEIDVPFTLQLHHFRGRIAGFFGENIHKVIWEKTGTTTMPQMIGDPEGDLLWNGVATFDVSRASNGDGRFARTTPGWGISRFGARAYFGDVPNDNYRADVCGWVPYYSTINAGSVPEVPSQPEGSRGILSARVDYQSPISSNAIGTMVCELQDFMPLTAINKPWLVKMFAAYNYTGSAPTTGAFEQRRDVTFHTGGQGVTEALVLADRAGVNNRPVVIDPAPMGNGNHKEAFIWRQSLLNAADPNKTEHVWSLITFPVVVGDQNPPLPELCADHTALNFGQPLPCQYAVPVDPFVPMTASFRRVPGTNRVQIVENGAVVGELQMKAGM